jgi:DNA-binding GntR family transcriptional regulator
MQHDDEDDFAYFTKNPFARHRIRAAFPNEFPRKFLKQGRGRPAVVIVGVLRDDAGRPTTRVRSVVFPDGGNA